MFINPSSISMLIHYVVIRMHVVWVLCAWFHYNLRNCFLSLHLQQYLFISWRRYYSSERMSEERNSAQLKRRIFFLWCYRDFSFSSFSYLCYVQGTEDAANLNRKRVRCRIRVTNTHFPLTTHKGGIFIKRLLAACAGRKCTKNVNLIRLKNLSA